MGGVCSCGLPVEGGSDPSSEFSSRDSVLIRLTWRQMFAETEMKTLSLDFFVLLFETHPYMQEFFGSYTTNTEKAVRSDFRMRIHSLTFLHRMGTFVEASAHPLMMVSLMDKLARSHVNKGVTCHDIENFNATFSVFIGNVLGRHLSKDVSDAWSRFFWTLSAVYTSVEKEYGLMGIRN